MRPTIPLSHWRLAIDLDATRAVREAEERHTRGCPCRICRNWARVHAGAVPAELQAQLRRVGIDPADPTELWASARPNGASYHVVFHCVGRILSGPPAMVTGHWGAGRDYRQLRADPPVSMTVSYLHDTVPGWVTDQMNPLIRVDLILDVPWVLDTPLDPPERKRPKPWRGVRPASKRTWRRRLRRFDESMQGEGDPG